MARGSVIGRYVVVDPLGAGGMGAVYSAYDPELDRRVALKLLGTGRQHPRAKERLLREAQALAKLSHPAVVTVFDAGTHGDDVFIAMEQLDGVTLEAWQREVSPSWRRALRVLLQAGEGLAAAHAQGLVHRDFKPANVMVRPGDRAAVLDFGLARRLDGSSDDIAAVDPLLDSSSGRLKDELTEAGTVVGTPAYMAPEQWGGGAVDERSDQFAFCVVAFRTLFGIPPFSGETQAALRLAVRRRECAPPPKGSPVPRAIQQTIVRGLDPDPKRRHPSMRTLLRELERGARRRRVTTIATVGVVAGVGIAGAAWTVAARDPPCSGLGGEMTATWGADRAAALEQAMTATNLAYAADSFARVKAALDGYAEAWVAARTDACVATLVRGEQSDRMMSLRVACLQGRRERLEALVDVLVLAAPETVENAVDAVTALPSLDLCSDADALLAEVAPPDDAQTAAEVESIRSLLAIAQAHGAAEQWDTTAEVLPSMLERAEATGYTPVIAEAQALAAVLAEHEGKHKEAIELYDASLWRSLAAGDTAGQIRALTGLTNVTGDRDPASGLALRHGRHLEALLAREGNPADESALASLYIGTAHMRLNQFEEAEARYREALERCGDTPRGRRTEVAATANLAALMGMQGRVEAARDLSRRALELGVERLGEHHPDVGQLLHILASVEMTSGRPAEALELFTRAQRLYAETLGPEHPRNGPVLQNIAVALRELGRHEEALAAASQALQIKRKSLQPSDPQLARSANNLGDALIALGRHAEALPLLEESLAVWGDNPRRLFSLMSLAEALSGLGAHEDAETRVRQALALVEEAQIVAAERGTVWFSAANILWQAGQRKDARDVATRAKQAYATAETDTKVQREAIDTWLADHT